MDALYQQFLKPASEFSPMPFWFWNDKLDRNKIRLQIEDFHKHGVEGFVLHPRMGIPKETPYLSDEFMECVKFAIEEADSRNMHVILYDEAMYPSGAANGKVVEKNLQFASRGLYTSEISQLNKSIEIPLENHDRVVAIYLAEKKQDDKYNRETINCLYPQKRNLIHISENKVTISKEIMEHFMEVGKRTKENCCCIVLIEKYTYGTIRGIHTDQDDGESEAPRSADLLNPEAVKLFIELTHERYRKVVGQYFGNTILAMFTDEPDIIGRNAKPGGIPWSNHFERYMYQEGLQIEDLPGLLFDIGKKTASLRQTYQKAINKRMLETYYVPIAEWCAQHNLYLTGHPANSDDIGLLEPFTIPGQDVVWRWVAPEDQKGLTGEHSTAAKCGADAARHYHRRRNLNEYLGVCGIDNTWNLSAADMKWYTDWLAVRGVNLFCPHAFYYSVEGRERSHERPPDVGPNNVWWQYYHYFSTYIKRISWLMTDSVNQAEIAVLTLDNRLPWKMAKYFYEHQIEFNYLHESLFINNHVKKEGDQLLAGKQSYRVVVIDGIELSAFDRSVKQQLTAFIINGGKVYVITDKRERNTQIDAVYLSPDNVSALHESFLPYRYAEWNKQSSDIRITKIKKSDQIFYFFTNEGERTYQGTIKFWDDPPIEEWNPWTGERSRLANNREGEYFFKLAYRESIIWSTTCSEESQKHYDDVDLSEVFEISPTLQPVNHKAMYWDKEILYDWSNSETLHYFSGTITYRFTFDYQGQVVDEIMLDLGEVYEIVEVSFNERESTVKMWSPYKVPFPGGSLRKGQNSIVVRVTNNSANNMDKKLLPSGLIGPVKVYGYRYKDKKG